MNKRAEVEDKELETLLDNLIDMVRALEEGRDTFRELMDVLLGILRKEMYKLYPTMSEDPKVMEAMLLVMREYSYILARNCGIDIDANLSSLDDTGVDDKEVERLVATSTLMGLALGRAMYILNKV